MDNSSDQETDFSCIFDNKGIKDKVCVVRKSEVAAKRSPDFRDRPVSMSVFLTSITVYPDLSGQYLAFLQSKTL